MRRDFFVVALQGREADRVLLDQLGRRGNLIVTRRRVCIAKVEPEWSVTCGCYCSSWRRFSRSAAPCRFPDRRRSV